MNELFIYISLAALLLLFILSSILYRKVRIWKLFSMIDIYWDFARKTRMLRNIYRNSKAYFPAIFV